MTDILRRGSVPLLLAAALCFSVMAGCSAGGENNDNTAPPDAAPKETDTYASGGVRTGGTSVGAEAGVSVDYDELDTTADWDGAEATKLTLEGASIAVDGDGATVSAGAATITGAGTYALSGTLDDGRIAVDAGDGDEVRLILNGADISCSDGAPIHIINAKKVVITLADGTENSVSDAAVYAETGEDAPNAAIYSKCDLTINGNGSLTVDANYNDALTCKDELRIMSGEIRINSVGDGIVGRDFVALRSGAITVVSGGEGVKSNNDKDGEKGFVLIESGTVSVEAQQDAVQAETKVLILDGIFDLTAGGGSSNGAQSDNRGGFGGMQASSVANTVSAKGIKAGSDITIAGGSFDIDTADDAIHSNGSLSITGGDFTIASGDDGIHADTSLGITNGDINITKSYEGIESAVITISGGNISVVSSDDGINVAGGGDGSAIGGRPGENGFTDTGSNYLSISAGFIYIDAAGDGIDVNGSAEMSGGAVIVNGPTDNANGALDYQSSFTVTGGLLVAAGSSGMAQAPSASSTQCSVLINFDSAYEAGTIVRIATDSGGDILTFAPAKKFQSLVVCGSGLEKGMTYTIYCGGSSDGVSENGLFSAGTYTAGTEYAKFTVSDTVTVVGEASGGFGRGGMGGNKPGGEGGMGGPERQFGGPGA